MVGRSESWNLPVTLRYRSAWVAIVRADSRYFAQVGAASGRPRRSLLDRTACRLTPAPFSYVSLISVIAISRLEGL